MIEIKLINPEQWQLHKKLRCAALAEAPYAFSSTLEDALNRSDEEWKQRTLRFANNPNSITYFAFENKTACGMAACALEGEEAEMFAVWVDPVFRRKGVGTALIEFALTWAKRHHAVQLKVGVYNDNPGAMKLYRSAGFQNTGLTKPEFSTENRTVLLLTMNLL